MLRVSLCENENIISIGFSGDLSFSGYYTGRYTEDLLDDQIKDFFVSNDYNVINYESPITKCKVTKKGYLAHRSDPEVLGFIEKNIKNPILSFANNHMMDYGNIGVADTLDYTAKAGVPILGMGTNAEKASRGIILGDEIKIGVFAFQYKKKGSATLRKGGPLHESALEHIKNTISYLKKECDYVVAVYHGGEEFVRTPMPYTRKFLKKVLGMGADVVVAHHPHVVQGYEHVGKKMIFYSLGNFIFDTDYQRIQDYTDEGILLKLSFAKDGFKYDYLPVKIERESGKINSGDESIVFEEVGKDYFRQWCKECLRIELVKKRKKQLKEQNKLGKKQLKDEKYEEIKEIIFRNEELYEDEKFLLKKADLISESGGDGEEDE